MIWECPRTLLRARRKCSASRHNDNQSALTKIRQGLECGGKAERRHRFRSDRMPCHKPAVGRNPPSTKKPCSAADRKVAGTARLELFKASLAPKAAPWRSGPY